jgi:hypothetical protein
VAADWEFPLLLTDPDREIVLRRLRAVRRAILPGTSVSDVVDQLTAQVEGRSDRIRLRLTRLDQFGLIHFSKCLDAIGVPERVDCLACAGSGKLEVPRQARNLADVFDIRYSLAQVGPPEREHWLNQHCDRSERDRVAAERQAEAERQKADLRRRELASYGVEPGTLAEGQPSYAEPEPFQFMPPSVTERSS